jgi:hypothetical protein
MKRFSTAVTAILILIAAAISCAQEMPAPGTTIDKNNYMKYRHLFPEEFAPAFADGFGSIIAPIHVNVAEKQSGGIPTGYIALSARNKGKYGLDAQGYITGGWAYSGFPFPALDPADKEFATKLMWNYAARYNGDDRVMRSVNCDRARGGQARWGETETTYLVFRGRIVCDPKPDLDNPEGIYRAIMTRTKSPEQLRNNMNLSFRYADPKKGDTIYQYTTTMRRPMRMEAMQRAATTSTSVNSSDDMYLFDGVVPQFTYTFVGEQTVLGITDAKTDDNLERQKKGDIPFRYDNYEVRDTWVIDIKPKNENYPQGRKRIWMDKEIRQPLYAVAWDHSGKVWKVWLASYKRYATGNEHFAAFRGQFGVDVQYGTATWYNAIVTPNLCDYEYADVSPSAMIKRGR